MASILDFFSMNAPNVMPTAADGSPDQLGFFGSNRNALVGLGLGLMGGTRDDPMGNALRGYTAGANADQQSIYRQYLMRKAAQERADTLAQREEAKKRDERDFAERQRQFDTGRTPTDFQREEFDWRKSQADKPPAGWILRPDGSMAFRPNGPADPAYIKAAGEAKEKPRQFSVTDVTKLSEEGGKFAQLSTFSDTFKPEYAGYGNQTIGEAATFMGRNMPMLTTENAKNAATWWQQYDRYKNVVRNELFGSALTKPESAAFERADVNPGMDPDQIKKNLATQQSISKNGLMRRANALIQAGYPADAISAAYGLDLKEIGVTATGKGSPAPTPGAAPPAPTPSTAPRADTPPPGVQYDNQDIVDARKAIATGKITKQQAMTRLLKAGIKVRPEDLD